jgi:hypothetical protein
MPAVCRSELMRTDIRLPRAIMGSRVGNAMHGFMYVLVHCIQIQCVALLKGKAPHALFCMSVYTHCSVHKRNVYVYKCVCI